VAPLAAPPPAPRALQQRLEVRAATEGPLALHAELARLDPTAAAAIDPRNVRRLIRAVAVLQMAVAQEDGAVARWSGRDDLWSPSYYHPTMLVGLTLPREDLYARINLRTRHMLREGAIEEVATILARYGQAGEGEGALARGIGKAIGFRLLAEHLRGKLALEDVEDRLAAATRAYARRQLTWMRKMPGVVIMDVSGREPGDVAAEIAAGVGHLGG
jgi:tRNA dimethylallyltransferase